MQRMNLVVVILVLCIGDKRLMVGLSFRLSSEHGLVQVLLVLVGHVVAAIHTDYRVGDLCEGGVRL